MPSQSYLLDRKWLEQEYLPELQGSVLFIGVRHYNDGYFGLVQDPDLFETVDIDPAQSQYGSLRHHVCLAEQLICIGRTFDHICAYGLFGMRDSVVDGHDITCFLNTMKRGVKPGGTLLYGASTDTMTIVEARQRFDDADFKSWEVLRDWQVQPSPSHSEMLILWVRKREG